MPGAKNISQGENINGIILKSLKYSDHTVIVTAYTENFGKIAFMVKGIGQNRKNKKQQYLQPLFPVQLQLHYRSKRELQFVNQISTLLPLHSIPFHPVKSALAFFVAEIIDKVFSNEEENRAVFHFIFHSIQTLDLLETGIGNFHLVFLIRLSSFLGFEPSAPNSNMPEMYFDLTSGNFTPTPDQFDYYIDNSASQILQKLLKTNYIDAATVKMTSHEREYLLQKLLDYYQIQLENRWKFNSLEVLKTLF